MVRSRVAHDEFARALKGLEHFDALGEEVRRRHHSGYVEQNVRILFEQEGTPVFDGAGELFAVIFRDAIPKLRLALVAVVYCVKHQILKVPAKGGEFHTDVHPGDVDAGHVVAVRKLEQVVSIGLKVAQVPWVLDVL